jgi:hypothetical protein
VYAAGTVDQMMCGKQFNRAVRVLILVYEALRSLWLLAFFQWCEDNGIVNPLPDPELISHPDANQAYPIYKRVNTENS